MHVKGEGSAGLYLGIVAVVGALDDGLDKVPVGVPFAPRPLVPAHNPLGDRQWRVRDRAPRAEDVLANRQRPAGQVLPEQVVDGGVLLQQQELV